MACQEAHKGASGLSEQQEIKNPKSNFTILPNLYDDADLTVYEFRLLIHYRRVGRTYESIRTTAKKTHMGKSTVDRARKGLADKGFIDLGIDEHGTIQIQVVDLWSRSPTSGGPSEGRPTQGHDQTNSPSQGRGVPETIEDRPRDDTKEVLKDLKKNLIKKKDRFSKNDKTPLAQVKASLLRDLSGGRMYATPPPEFERMYGALEMISIEGSPPVVVLSHPERDLLLQDDRILRPLLTAFAGVLGYEAEVKIEEVAVNA